MPTNCECKTPQKYVGHRGDYWCRLCGGFVDFGPKEGSHEQPDSQEAQA